MNNELNNNEDYERLVAENTRLKKIFEQTERWMLIDGEYEAAPCGSYERLEAENSRLNSEIEELKQRLSVQINLNEKSTNTK